MYLEDRKTPMPGQIYKHFKGRLYQIVTVASHTETEEVLVIYQALYGDYKFYARPISMFMSQVDRSKYPSITAVYRFEIYNPVDNLNLKEDSLDEGNVDESNKKENIQNQEILEKDSQRSKQGDFSIEEIVPVNSILMEFLEATTFREKLEIVQSNRKSLTDKIINNMAMSIDCTVMEGDMEERISSLIYCLQTRIRFEARRLR